MIISSKLWDDKAKSQVNFQKKEDGILFIDASQEYDNSNQLNRLRKKDINKIVNTYKNKEEIDKYSYFADMAEIKANDFNLNIKRYVNTYEEKEKIDVDKTIEEINNLKNTINELSLKEKELLEKLNIKL